MSNQPKIIQLFFDGTEVLRVEDGVKVHELLVPADTQPKLIEMWWDGSIVYAFSPQSSQVLFSEQAKSFMS